MFLIKQLAAVLALVSGSAMAADFTGFYGQVGTGYEKNNFSNISTNFVNADAGGFSGRGSAANQSTSGAPLVIGAGYFHLLKDEYLLGFGVDYSPLSKQSGSFSSITTNDDGVTFPINNMSYKVSNRLNAYLMPAYAFDEDKLGYLKLGYSIQKLQYTQGADSGTDINSGYTASKNVSGYVLGLGYKQIITGGIYGYVEGNYYSYGKSTLNGNATAGGSIGAVQNIAMSSTASISAYNFLVGVGYKF